MIGLGLLVLIVVLAVVIFSVTRSSRAQPVVPATAPTPPRETIHQATTTRQLSDRLHEWVAAGLLSSAQAEAILAHETAKQPAIAPPVAPRPVRARRIPVVAEALGYLGGMLAVVGLGLIVARYWADMPTAGRLALSGGIAVALWLAGLFVHEAADPALARLRWFLWLASTAAAGLFAGVFAADVFDAEAPETVVLACAGVVALESGLLWQWRRRPVQQLTFIAATIVFGGAAVAQIAGTGFVGLTVWALAAVALIAGLRRVTPLPLLTETAGAVGVVIGSVMTAADWPAFGLLFAVATAFALLAVATVAQIRTEPADRLITALAGAIALVETAPGALGYFGEKSGMATGLITWAAGAGLLYIGARRLVRAPVVAQILGAGAVLGGAALTGTQWTGFAPVFGIATAVALIALGMLPGQVLLSVFGCVGLLVNVPWAIGWFFPGEGRAPILILVSGALILGVALLLARQGGRFRRELANPRRGPRQPPRAAPGAI